MLRMPRFSCLASLVLAVLLAAQCWSQSSWFTFQDMVEEEMRERLSSLNFTRAINQLYQYANTISELRPSGLTRRSIADNYLGLNPNMDPGSNIMGKELSSLVEVLQLGQVAYEVENSLFGGASCTACKAGLMFLKYYLETGVQEEEAIGNTLLMCKTFSMVKEGVCQGLIKGFGHEVYTVIKTVNQSAEEMCGFMFGQACNMPHNPLHEWDVLLPPIVKPTRAEAKKPARPEANKSANTEAKKSLSPDVEVVEGGGGEVAGGGGRQIIRVLHLSDTHFDPYYQEGSNANCGDFLCCRESSGPATGESDGAGYWGDYRKCDTPLRTIESMYRYIATNHTDIGLIYWTGDLPPHDIWNQTKEGNLEVVQATAHQLRTHFPNTLILPALGNHESVPVDSFPPPFVSGEHNISWLYSVLESEWGTWLGSGPGSTVRYGAYYSVNIAPGLRVISLNMNYCMNKNVWLLLNSYDPAEELRWLTYELQLAEFKGEKVHIIGHIPPGHVDCVHVWSKNFNQVIDRYESTVTAQFYGHTHLDEFEVFFDSGNRTRPNNIAYIGPSVTPYYGLNPSYRIYDVDAATGEVLDHETYFMDLETANSRGPEVEPVWEKLYSAKEAYGMESLQPSEWNRLVERMEKDSDLFEKFYSFYHSGSRLRPNCDIICRKQIFCNLKSSRSHAMAETCNAGPGYWNKWNVMGWFS